MESAGLFNREAGTLSAREPNLSVAKQWCRLLWLRKNSQLMIPMGGVCPRNLMFPGCREEMQIPRFARDGKTHFFHGPRGLSYQIWANCEDWAMPEDFAAEGLPWRGLRPAA